MILDTPAYEAALARERLRLGVTFDESKHPRLHGRFAKKRLGEGLTAPTKSPAHVVRESSNVPGWAREAIAPLKHVEHKKINDLLRRKGAAGTPEPRRLIEHPPSKYEPPGSPTKLWVDIFGKYNIGDVEHDLAHADRVLAHHTLKRDVTVLRAVPPADVKDKKVGDTWTEHGFVSTSQTEEGSKGFTEGFSTFKGGKERAYMKITAPKGTHAFDYGHKDEDRELVLDRGLKYEVTGEERDPDGNRVLLVKVVS